MTPEEQHELTLRSKALALSQKVRDGRADSGDIYIVLRAAEAEARERALEDAGLECVTEASGLDEAGAVAGDPAVMSALRCAHRIRALKSAPKEPKK